MKKIFLVFAILLVNSIQAQMTVTKHDGTPILDGQTLTFISTNFAESELAFYVHNNTSSNMITRISCENMTNSDGSGMELCYGNVCLPSVTIGESYPSSPFTIAPNSVSGNFDHFLNTNNGDGIHYPMDYTFRFYQLDTSGNEVGNSITFTYRFQPVLASNSFNQLENMGVKIKSTLISNQLEFDNTTDVAMEMYDLSGKLVRNSKFISGNQSVDVSNLSSGSYILNFIDNKGSRASKQLIKR
jgi:Secretion system C-terminal sorting domain